MPQFAIEAEIHISQGETLAGTLNSILHDKPFWKVAAIHTIITGKIEPIMLATVVIDAAPEDMPEIKKQEG